MELLCPVLSGLVTQELTKALSEVETPWKMLCHGWNPQQGSGSLLSFMAAVLGAGRGPLRGGGLWMTGVDGPELQQLLKKVCCITKCPVCLTGELVASSSASPFLYPLEIAHSCSFLRCTVASASHFLSAAIISSQKRSDTSMISSAARLKAFRFVPTLQCSKPQVQASTCSGNAARSLRRSPHQCAHYSPRFTCSLSSFLAQISV